MTRVGPVPSSFDVSAVDLASVDGVLATTRSVRRRLDLKRSVPDDLLLDCIDLAEQSPTGGNQGSRRWIIARDPEVKAKLAEVYNEFGQFLVAIRDRKIAEGREPSPMTKSGAYLAEHLAEVPAIVIPCIWGVHAGTGRPGLFDSVIQGAWSFCLAARARGLATAWTTAHLANPEAAAEILGIPEGVTQIALLPVAWSKGPSYRGAARRPAEEITYIDRWAHTYEHYDSAGTHGLDEGPGLVAEADVSAPPQRVFELISDVNVGAQFSAELIGADWLHGAEGPSVGARFAGHNRNAKGDEWTVTCTITELEPAYRLGWAVGETEEVAGARWRFEVDHLQSGDARLRHTVRLGPGFSGLSAYLDTIPVEQHRNVISVRQQSLLASMQATVDGIKALAEGV